MLAHDPDANRSLWAWGDTADEPPEADLRGALEHMGGFLGLELDGQLEMPAPFSAERVPAARYELPAQLSEFVTQDARVRAVRAWGSS
ncbi:MAG: hypothetical protein JHC87_06430, partial [Thermoleophilaceae bacterium]|nr:hypothetical protein [Thermoleophilaceae bacterium]